MKQGKKYTVITGRGYRPREIALGRWKWAALAFVFFYLSIEVFIPFCVLLWASLLPYLQLPSAEALSSLTLKHYIEMPNHVGARPFINTLILMFAVPTVTMILSVLVSWIVIRTQVSFRGFLDTLAFIPHAVPGILMAVGLAYLGFAYRDYFPVLRHSLDHRPRAYDQLDRLRHPHDQQRHDPSPPRAGRSRQGFRGFGAASLGENRFAADRRRRAQ